MIVDATLIATPPSINSKAKARDPQMHQAKKGKIWHFGLKAHVGLHAHSGLVHTQGPAATRTTSNSGSCETTETSQLVVFYRSSNNSFAAKLMRYG